MARKTTTKRIDYRPYDIEQMSNKEVRKAYSELRKTALLRQKRLKAAGFVGSYSGKTKYWTFPALKGMSNAAVASALADVAFYLRNPMTLVTEQRKSMAELSEKFMSEFEIYIDPKDIPRFMDFLDELRARYGAKQVDSERVSELWDQMEQKNISAANVVKNYSFFLENQEKIKELNIKARKRPYTARDFQLMGIDPDAELNTAKPPRRQPRRGRGKSKKR